MGTSREMQFARRSTLKAIAAKRLSAPKCAVCHGVDIMGQHTTAFVRLFSAVKCGELIASGVSADSALDQAAMSVYLVCPNENADLSGVTYRWFRSDAIPDGYVISK